MTAAVRSRPGGPAPVSGGSPARRAVVRWAWRMFRREWRQQLIVLGLLIVAVAAATVGIAVATGAPTSPSAEFGTANHLLTITGSPSQLAAGIRAAARDLGSIEVIEHQKVNIPGSVNTTDLRSQSPDGNYSHPMLRLDAGSFPAGPDHVAVTAGVASIYQLGIGSSWHENGRALTVTGIVENPGDWQDQFALVAPGQISAPQEATVLFNAGRAQLDRLAPAANEQVQGRAPYNPGFPPAAVLVFDTHRADVRRADRRGRFHRARPSAVAGAGHARRCRRDGPAHPAGRARQRRRGRRHRRGYRHRGRPAPAGRPSSRTWRRSSSTGSRPSACPGGRLPRPWC